MSNSANNNKNTNRTYKRTLRTSLASFFNQNSEKLKQEIAVLEEKHHEFAKEFKGASPEKIKNKIFILNNPKKKTKKNKYTRNKNVKKNKLEQIKLLKYYQKTKMQNTRRRLSRVDLKIDPETINIITQSTRQSTRQSIRP